MMMGLYIRDDGTPTRELESARRNIKAWQATLPRPVDISDWPNEAIATLDMAVRYSLARLPRICGNPFAVAPGGLYSCISALDHRYILQSEFEKVRSSVAPVVIDGKSYTLAAARDLLDARENCGRAS